MEVSLLLKGKTEVVVCFGPLWANCQRTADALNSGLVLSELGVSYAKQVPCVGLIRLGPKDSAINLLGKLQPARVVMLGCQSDASEIVAMLECFILAPHTSAATSRGRRPQHCERNAGRLSAANSASDCGASPESRPGAGDRWPARPRYARTARCPLRRALANQDLKGC